MTHRCRALSRLLGAPAVPIHSVAHVCAAALFIGGSTEIAGAARLTASHVLPFLRSSVRLLLARPDLFAVVPDREIFMLEYSTTILTALNSVILLAERQHADAWPQLAAEELPPGPLVSFLESCVAFERQRQAQQRRGREPCNACIVRGWLRHQLVHKAFLIGPSTACRCASQPRPAGHCSTSPPAHLQPAAGTC